MKKVVKKILGVTIIYVVAILCTFIVTNRVSELDNKGDLRNSNTSLSINFTR